MNKPSLVSKIITTIVTLLVGVTVLAFTVKGQTGSPIYFQNELSTIVGGPFETSNSTSRYATVKSIVDNHSLFLNDQLAKFASPDLVFYKGKYFSIFLPGVSILAAPLYYLGSLVGLPQLFTYFLNLILALFSCYLIYRISRELGGRHWGSLIASFSYLFATNVLAYTETLTQHVLTSTLLLLSLYNALLPRTLWRNFLFGALFGYAMLVDIPNLFIFLPLIIYLLLTHFEYARYAQKYVLKLKLNVFLIALGTLPLICAFGWYNFTLTGSPFQIGQNIGRTDYIDTISPTPTPTPLLSQIEPSIYDKKLALNTRKLINGFYILLTSDERGMLYFEPVILIGILGIWALYQDKKHRTIAVTIFSITVFTLLTYALFGDPWGGWSFGPRYMIPATTMLCVLVGPALARYSKTVLVPGIGLILSVYSLYINFLGVLTTTSIPPKNEALNLLSPIPYTYQYNLDIISSNHLSSLLYNIFIYPIVDAKNFFYLCFDLTSFVFTVLYLLQYFESKGDL